MNKHARMAALGLHDSEAAFKRTWGLMGMPVIQRGAEGLVTQTSRQKMQARKRDAWEKNCKGLTATLLGAQVAQGRGEYADFVKALQPRQKALVEGAGIGNAGSIGGNVAAGVVPLVFDPDIVRILKDVAPILERVPQVGQQGFKAVVNRIDARGAALGFRTEAESLDMSGETENDDTYGQIEVDMEIWEDLVVTSDYAQAAGQHYFDPRDTQLGERVANYAQEQERNVVYGDPALATATGGFGDARGFEGFATIIEDAGNSVDKSGVSLSGTDALLKDIKAEITTMLQGPNAVFAADLEIWTSHTMFDELENELEVRRRINDDRNSANYGFEMISIKGVDVIASHNIKQHTDDGNNVGDDGDVFIMNRREFQDRALMPLSTVPLARVGLSERAAMAQFSAPVMRGAGNLSRWLKAYAI